MHCMNGSSTLGGVDHESVKLLFYYLQKDEQTNITEEAYVSTLGSDSEGL